MDKAECLDELFAGRRCDRDVIILCALVPSVQTEPARLAEMMAERGLSLAQTTIMRWVRH
jgi:transposase-like protein